MSLTLHEHPFASYCWKALIALYERDVPFERHFVGGPEDRAQLAELWPLGSIPVLVDSAGPALPESTAIIDYLDRHGSAPPLIPTEPDAAIQARLWDRLMDGHVMTPMQKIVADALRPEGSEDPHGVDEARAPSSMPPTPCSTIASPAEAGGSPGRTSPSPTVPPRPRSTTREWCTAGTRRSSPR